VATLALAALAREVLHAPSPALPRRFTEPRSGTEFALIAPGTFRMGTPDDEQGREAVEVLRTVTISRGFYLGRHEVTQGQWRSIMGSNPSAFQDCGPRCPVEGVTWFDVQEFLSQLNARGGPHYRLPTEAEWEYACRASGSEPFGHRATLSSRDANINGTYPYNAPQGTFRRTPLPVGSFPANPWGLYDMSGNVWEWLQDPFCPYPDGPATDPVGTCESDRRVIRGGSWLFDGASARCGLRYTHRPQDKGYSLGFRLAMDPH
jgi:formylglycine-generating enzyme required for sulfatase activity